jgi:hypothetical protein
VAEIVKRVKKLRNAGQGSAADHAADKAQQVSLIHRGTVLSKMLARDWVSLCGGRPF